VNIICNSEVFLSGVNDVERSVSSSDAQPLLTCIYLSAQDGKIILRATDKEIGVQRVIDAEVIEPGEMALDGRLLSGLARRLSGDTVSLRKEGNEQVLIESGASEFKLQTHESQNFPNLPPDAEFEFSSIKAEELLFAIKQTIFAVAKDDSRPVFTGVFMKVQGKEIVVSATDSNRLAIRTMKTVDDSKQNAFCILPQKSVQELSRLLDSRKDGLVQFAIREGLVLFKMPDLLFVTRTIEGQFPDYKRAIPSKLPLKIVLNRIQFLDAVDRVSLVTRKGTPSVKLSINENVLNLSSQEVEIGQGHETIAIEQEGDSLEMAYQSRFLIDVLRVLPQEKVVMEIGPDMLPAIIRGLEDNDYLYVLMPVRLG
jgi:DNA polymerase-3 subunit beta